MENRASDKAREEALNLIRSAVRKDMAELCKKSDERQAQREKEEKEWLAKREKEKKERQAQQEKERLRAKMSQGTLDERFRAFQALYPNAQIESPDEVINDYTALTIQLLTEMATADRDKGRHMADLVCEKYTSIFTGMKDFVPLRAAAATKILSYSYVNAPFRIPSSNRSEVESLLNRISTWGKTANSPMLSMRWAKIYDAGKLRSLMEAWATVDQQYISYLNQLELS